MRLAAAVLASAAAAAVLVTTAAAADPQPRSEQYVNGAVQVIEEEPGPGATLGAQEVVIDVLPFTGTQLALAAIGGAGLLGIGLVLRTRRRH